MALEKPVQEFREKMARLLPGQLAFLKFIEDRAARQQDTAEEDLARIFHRPKGDAGTYYRLETLRRLGFLKRTQAGHGPGTIRYGLSDKYQDYLNQVKKYFGHETNY